jgi:hypothetical protein
MLTATSFLKLSDSLIVRKDDEVIFDFKKNSIYECNSVGFDILKRFDKTIRLEEVFKNIEFEYESTEDNIREEIISFLEEAIRDGIMVVQEME